MSSSLSSARERFLDRPGQMLQVTEWGSDGAESTYFFFPEGEEINAAAAETYYGFYNIYTVLHSVSRFGDSVRDLHAAGAGASANIFLW